MKERHYNRAGMICREILDRFPPPSGKRCWPWDLDLASDTYRTDCNPDRPRVTIITPSYNQGGTIEETIRSVLLQGYPNLEYIICDGGSTDNSVEIIRRYEDHLCRWITEKDKGQSDAINKGLKISEGEIIGWLNSDDIYMPYALHRVVDAFQRNPEGLVLIGAGDIVDEEGNRTWFKPPMYLDLKDLLTGVAVPLQTSVFIKREVYSAIGGIDEGLHYVNDWEYWTRIGLRYQTSEMILLDEVLSKAVNSSTNKTSKGMRIRDGGYHLNHMERMRVIESMFSMPDLSTDVSKMKGMAYGMHYLILANDLIVAGYRKEAQRTLFKALFYLWKGPRIMDVLKYYIKSLLYSPDLKKVRGLGDCCRDVFKRH